MSDSLGPNARTLKHAISLALLVLAMSVCAGSSLLSQSTTGLPWLGEALKSVLTLRVIDRYGDVVALGTGFLLNGGVAVTNAHVLRGASEIEMLDSNGASIGKVSSLLLADPVLDLALLAVPLGAQKGLRLSEQDANVGDYVMAIGSPLGLSQSVSDGIASGIRRDDSAPRLQITAPISPGSSGGPVVNRAGQVVGVAVQSLVAGQNLNFAVPVSSLRPFVRRDRKLVPLDNFRFAAQLESKVTCPDHSVGGVKIPRMSVGQDATFTLDGGSLGLVIDGKPFEELRLRVDSQEKLSDWRLTSIVAGKSQSLRSYLVETKEVRAYGIILPASGCALLELYRDDSSGFFPFSVSVSLPPLGEKESAEAKKIGSVDLDASRFLAVSLLNLDYKGAKSFIDGERMVRVAAVFTTLNRETLALSETRQEVEFDCFARSFRVVSIERNETDGKTAWTINTEIENIRLRLMKQFRSIEGEADMPFLIHFACGMWGPK